MIEGECLLVVEEQEPARRVGLLPLPGRHRARHRRRRHGPAIVVAVGARGAGSAAASSTRSPSSRRATAGRRARDDHSAEAYAEIYAELPRSRFVPYEPGALPGGD